MQGESHLRYARFPHDVATEFENSLESGETKAQFIVTAVKSEIKRRQRRKKADTSED
ncbi:YlcI/YnfO family protein [Enterobacter pasteurii]